MGNTPNFSFPYPDGGSLMDNANIEDLARAVDSELYDMESTQNPGFINITLESPWQSVDTPVRVYRMGRLCVLTGEIWIQGTGPISPAQQLFGTLPVGYRPTVRTRVPAIRTAASPVGDVHILTNGSLRIIDVIKSSATPGYSINASWIVSE